MTLERILIVPDCHHPFHDKRAWAGLLAFSQAWQPHRVIILGDFVDFYSVSFHLKDPKRRIRLKDELASGREALKDLANSSPNASRVFIEGNHEFRFSRYLHTYAAQLDGIVSLESELGITDLSYQYVPYKTSYEYGGVRYTHDLGDVGKTAVAKAMEATGRSTVIGHVHRMQMIVNGTVDGHTHVGASFGWLGDIEHVDYTYRDRAAKDWHLGFGIGYCNNTSNKTHLALVPFTDDYSFVMEGVLYKVETT